MSEQTTRDPRVEPRAGDVLGVNTQTWYVTKSNSDGVCYEVNGGWFNYSLNRDEWAQTCRDATIIHAERE